MKSEVIEIGKGMGGKRWAIGYGNGREGAESGEKYADGSRKGNGEKVDEMWRRLHYLAMELYNTASEALGQIDCTRRWRSIQIIQLPQRCGKDASAINDVIVDILRRLHCKQHQSGVMKKSKNEEKSRISGKITGEVHC